MKSLQDLNGYPEWDKIIKVVINSLKINTKRIRDLCFHLLSVEIRSSRICSSNLSSENN